MTILITGVAGLIGSRLAKWIVENTKHGIVGVDDLSGGYFENVPPSIDFHSFDCGNKNNMGWIFKHYKPDIVYHFAAYAAEGLSPFIRTFNYTNNLIATANIVNLCIQQEVKRLVFASSMAVYGDGHPPFHETDDTRPCDPYANAKLACEMDIKIAGQQHRLDWCIVRPHNVYGEGQNLWDKYRNVLGIWMRQHLDGKKLTIFGSGEQRRAFTYVGDILKPLYIAGTNEIASKEIINLGCAFQTTVIEAAQLLIQIMGGGEIEHLLKRHEVANAYSTHRKASDLLGYSDDTPLEFGLTSMWAWAKEQPRREVKKMTYEIEKGMYESWK